jgi:hypothetical protein
MNAYLHDKITEHVAAILAAYMDNPDDVELATEDILEAVEREIIWASCGTTPPPQPPGTSNPC